MKRDENLRQSDNIPTAVLPLKADGKDAVAEQLVIAGESNTNIGPSIAVRVTPAVSTHTYALHTRGQLSGTESETIAPIMTRDELEQELLALERKHSMASEELYRRWQAGVALRFLDAFRWVMLYELWRDRYLMP